ncbi:MAG: hypothetical protein Q7J38_12195 [Gallionella sp.]|nr:hypothetical protein [Gallionella sp.]
MVARYSIRNWPLSGNQTDWLITLLFTAFWLWFAWQHGYTNSPDSWYRGVLANSIIEGHPYFINLRQGWLYDYPAWHPDAAHPPFLPALYALYFFFFGPQISITNVIVSVSAGLLVFPLLRFSRLLTGAPIAGLLVYLAIACNDKADFLFEVFSGLSIPVTIALLATAFYFMRKLADTGALRDLWCGALALVGFYYVRPGEQLIFGWLMLSTLILGYRLLPRRLWIRQMQMWGAASLLVLPWAVRNFVLLGSPFFSHMSPLLWADRGYDYWDYHETVPLPSSAAYFATHTLHDFTSKIAGSSLHYGELLNDALSGQLLMLVGGVIYALIVVLVKVKEPRTRYLFMLLFLCLAGYSILYSMVPLLDKRYMMMPQFVILMMIAMAAWLPSLSLRLRLPVIVVLAIYLLTVQAVFWGQRFGTYLTFSYTNSDQVLARDPTIPALQQRVHQNEAIMSYIASAQEINFATGLTIIEKPANFHLLKDPVAFFKRYQIRYSLADVSRILPEEMIESIELAGNSPLFTIRLDGNSSGGQTSPKISAAFVQPDAQDQISVAAGVKTRQVYVDGFHGVPPSELKALLAKTGNVEVGNVDLLTNRKLLMHSGLYVLRYGMGKPKPSEAELQIIEQFVAAGGRVLLLCAAWVPDSYEKQDLSELSFNRIARGFGLLFSPELAEEPLYVTDATSSAGKKKLSLQSMAFSKLIGRRTTLDFASDAAGSSIVIGQIRGKARVVLGGHDNLFESMVSSTDEGRELQGRILSWLFAED